MSSPVRVPAAPEEPQGPVVVPPEGAPTADYVAALVAALVAGAAFAIIVLILARFLRKTPAYVMRIALQLSWEWWARGTADTLSLLPRTLSPDVQVLHQQAIQNAYRRAAYLMAAARRMSAAVDSKDQSQIDTALQREARYRQAHELAERQRDEAARVVVEALPLARYTVKGELLLGWSSRRGATTCAICRKAHGRNFNALVRPRIGFPGDVHPYCRCTPRRPWDTNLRVESSAVAVLVRSHV